MSDVKPIMELATEMIGGQSDSLPLNTIDFYPAERVREFFERLKAARGTDREAAELRIFAERMIWLYENQSEERNTFLDFDEAGSFVAYGEAMADAARTAELEAEAAHV
jgi:hypothetical protein